MGDTRPLVMVYTKVFGGELPERRHEDGGGDHVRVSSGGEETSIWETIIIL